MQQGLPSDTSVLSLSPLWGGLGRGGVPEKEPGPAGWLAATPEKDKRCGGAVEERQAEEFGADQGWTGSGGEENGYAGSSCCGRAAAL